MHQPKRLQRSAPRGRSGRNNSPRVSGSPLLSILFFPVAIFYHEMLLRIFDKESSVFSAATFRILLFSIAAGLLIFLILDLLPWRKAARTTGTVLLVIGTVILCVERGCRSMFGVYYGLTFMGGMAGDVVGNFASTIWDVFLSIIPFILLALIPLVVYRFLRFSIVYEKGQPGIVRVMLAAVLVVCQLAGFLISSMGSTKNYYTYEFAANTSISQFGLVTSLRLEIEYAIFGMPEAPLPVIDPGILPSENTDPSADVSADASQEPSATPVVYGYNELDIDFEALAASASNDTVKALHQYFGGLTPSRQNEYTGMFEGKNLILITAEAFSPYVISEELTPTLYKLSHEGFVFNNYYQPNWTQSTSGGEFAVMTGLIPNWFGSQTAFTASADKDMPISLAKQFSKLGYNVPAWHNNGYTYYNRDKTHPNLGYDYQGIGNGLVLASDQWPNSDLEMMQATVDSYISDYAENGTPFHAYYMTVSGHCNYNWGGNAMSKKHRAEAEAAYPNASETVQAYIACNLELEAAMTYLVEQLEEAGIADDTLIVLTADHYPYQMAAGDVDYYNELTGLNDSERDTSRFRNTLIMWSASIDEPVQVDTPCSSIDIVPTLCNLYGLDYDSRLYSGRDIFATNYEADQASTCMPLVIFANTGYGNSWITAAGTYEASSGTFTPNEGITVDDSYVSTVSSLVQAKYTYAKQIIQQDYYQILENNGVVF